MLIANMNWIFLEKFFRSFLMVVVIGWLAKSIGAELFGVLSVSLAIVEIVRSISAFGMQGVIVRDLAKHPEQTSNILINALTIQVALASLGLLICFALAYYFYWQSEILALTVAIYASSLLILPFSIIKYHFEANIKSKYASVSSIFSQIVTYSILVLLLWYDAHYFVLVIALTIELFLSSLILLIFFLKNSPRLSFSGVNIKSLRAYLEECWPLAISAAAVVLYMKIDTVMIAKLYSAEMAGVYSAAARISEMVYFLPMAIVATLFPLLYQNSSRLPEFYDRSLQMLYDVFSILGLLFLGFCFLFSSDVIFLVYGEKFAGSAEILVIHAISAVFMFWGFINHRWMLNEGLHSIILKRTILGCALNLGLNYVLIPEQGGVGAALATVISYSCIAFFFDIFHTRTRQVMKKKISSLVGFNWYASVRIFFSLLRNVGKNPVSDSI